MAKLRIAPIALFLLFSLPLIGQELPLAPDSPRAADIYSLGDQTFAISSGAMFPLFFQFIKTGEIAESTNLSVGIGGSLEWNTYLSNNFTLGIEVGGQFAFSPNSRTLIMVPLTMKAAYWLHLFPFDLAFHISPGINLCKLEDDTSIGPILMPGISGYWKYNSEWSFGANLKYMWVPQIYFEDGAVTDQSMFGNFLTLTLSAQYHF